METSRGFISGKCKLGSYRTYEEWKHLFLTKRFSENIFRSYRTYEEWKLALRLATLELLIGSYRTYEEWKPATY